ncbi:glycerate kinase [Terasakiella sp. SH-1]|uniref:glycerate kinase type-2 family protein n=1 Tax=Terasakiella sp. SH-1 TaxID=2560057 RepID=UPI0010730892|nr:glycerate kinase [Terasakiella sp. SH-1]
MSSDNKELLHRLFRAAVSSAVPDQVIKQHLPEPPKGRTIVLGAGKASAAMARAFEQAWEHPLEGLVVTRYGYEVPCDHIEIIQASHPVPDEASEIAATRILEYAETAGPDDLVIFLISGGGSALLVKPAGPLTLEDKQDINQQLLSCGATIDEMNCVRKHLSAIKGGRLAQAAAPAKVVTLTISDVPGDDPAVIASGPTVPDPTTRQDALALLERYDIQLPDHVMNWLQDDACETPKENDPAFQNVDLRMVATPQMALLAAAKELNAFSATPYILGDSIEGEARDVALVHAGIAKQVVKWDQPFEVPCVLLSGGETTVTLRGQGRGGRNVEFLLALAIALDGQKGVYAIAGDTDGVDGAEEIAGAIITPDTLERARALGLNPQAELDNNNAHEFFEKLGDQVITGPTLTNVNDFRAILIEK